MSVFKSDYDTGTTITITLASLTNTSARSSLAVDNSTNLYLDVLVEMKIKTGAASTSANGFINIYAYGSADGGTTYPEGCGTDTGITLVVPTNLKLIGTLNTVANATTYIGEPMSVAAAFGGVMPQHWGIAIENQSGGTLDTSEGNFAKLMQGVWGQSV